MIHRASQTPGRRSSAPAGRSAGPRSADDPGRPGRAARAAGIDDDRTTTPAPSAGGAAGRLADDGAAAPAPPPEALLPGEDVGDAPRPSAPRGAMAIDPEERLQHALDAAYRYLGHRDRTVAELRRHLEGKRVEPATIDQALAALADQGYLDDARYARTFAEDRRLLDAWGADRIERRLRALGVAPEHIEAALEAQDAAGELDAALALLRRRIPVPPADDRARDRCLGVLARKGYDLEVAYDAVRAYSRESAA